MTHGIPTYPSMRPSGVHWLGAVPSHWERRRLKSLLRPIDRRSTTGSETLLSLRRDHGIVVYSEHFSRPAQGATTVGYKIVTKGQLVVNRLQANNGLVFDSSLDGLVSPDYSVFESRNSAPIAMTFLTMLLRTQIYRDHFRRESTGLGTGSAGFLRLYDDRFLETPVAVPPADEQASILRFIDHADRRIRRYIRAKQKLITLLDEQKQAIIHRSVTRGLDARVLLKPSGAAWLGDVPHHWEVRKLRQCGSISGGVTPSMTDRSLWDGDVPWVTPKDMKRFTIAAASMNVSARALEITSLRLIPAGSVLLVVRGMILARKVPVARTIQPVTINQDMKAIVPTTGVNAGFLAYRMQAAQAAFVPLIDEAGHGTKRFPTERWKDLALAIPPPNEQTHIVSYLDEVSGRLDAAAATAQREIDLLREYRTRFTADVVTGKLDVRVAAAQLPEDASDTEPLVEPDAETQEQEYTDQVEPVTAEADA
jgi:type I restriction enzyme S subunit